MPHKECGDKLSRNLKLPNVVNYLKSMFQFLGIRLPEKVAAQLKQPLFINASYILGVNVLPAVIGFVFWWLASRFYSTSDIGIASAVIASVALVATIAGLGLSTGIIRFLPGSAQPNQLLNSVYLLVFIVSVIGGSIFLFGLTIWSQDLIFLRRNVLNISTFLFFTIFVSLGTATRATFIACRQARFAFIYTLLTNCVRLVFVIFFVGLGSTGLIGSAVIAFGIGLIFNLFIIMPKVDLNYHLSIQFNWSCLRPILPYSLGNFISDIIFLLPQTIIPLLILSLLGSEANGYAYIALLIGGLLGSLGFALGRSAFAEGANAPQDISLILSKASIAGLLLTIPVAILVVIVAPWLLMLFGIDYSQEASGLLRWMAMSTPFIVLNQLYFTYLRLVKEIKVLILVSGVLVAFSLGVTAFLLPYINISAAGIGIFIGNSLVSFIVIMRLGKIDQLKFEIRNLYKDFFHKNGI